jgi:hypothetical protein
MGKLLLNTVLGLIKKLNIVLKQLAKDTWDIKK